MMRPPNWKWLRLLALGFFLTAVPACSIAPREDGQGYVLGVGMTGDGSGEELGQKAGSFLSILGVPGADALGGLIGGGLGLLGIGTAAHYRSRRKGEREGWDEAKQDADAAKSKLDAEWYEAKLDAARSRGVGGGIATAPDRIDPLA